ncbi:[protein-PII] uridylyltransferase [Sphingomonas sp. ASV193]|uniref:[protein-PII] uridylyltransferase n=1 Tax=Sphingomonas sp. ASV193 TaxID=3144405 RepID=UPI0032E8F3DC
MTDQPRLPAVANRRAILDRRAIADRLAAAAPEEAGAILAAALAAGREEIGERLAAHPSNGRTAAAAYAFLADQVVRLAFDHAALRLHPTSNPAPAERIALVGVGGTGRGELAPYSDIDLMLLVGGHGGTTEKVAEALFYQLWDLKLKVGQSVRTVDEAIASAKSDMTIRTALLESRWLWGERPLFDAFEQRFAREIVKGHAAEFVAAKMAERDERHRKMGDSRYVVEPNVKDGKGGLRDLHTLYWIARFALGASSPRDMVAKGLLSEAEFARFDRAERFFWAVRCHLHRLAGRAEERLGFEYQPRIATAMRYADRPGKSAVERFMQFYFLQAKTVGDLTGVLLAQLDEQLGKKGRRFALPTFTRKPRHLNGFTIDRGRLSIPSDDFLAERPTRLIELFALAAREGLELHPKAMRAATAQARLADTIRDDPEANALFLSVLTDIKAPDTVLRWMNEAGVFGRFMPDFGRVVAQMQFDMYHHYTVDEHSIRAIGLLAAIERGEMAKDHPLSSALFRQLESRRTLYVAVLLHDIAKGRGGDHSELGEAIAYELCPRLGLDEGETETVAWLVRHHLLMSRIAFRRDLTDPKTIDDFVHVVQSPERLRLLVMLTVVDIRAVGPGTWNEWKRQLLKTLYEAAEERLRLGHVQHGRRERVAERQAALDEAMGWTRAAAKAHARRLPDSYWLAEQPALHHANALQVATAGARLGETRPSVEAAPDPDSGATRLSVFAPDRPGLFAAISAALARAGANIIDARIHTTRDGFALDNLLVLNGQGRAYAEGRQTARLAETIERVLADGQVPQPPPPLRVPQREEHFQIAPRVLVAENASNKTTVVEVNARDRQGLLARLARTLADRSVSLHSAHIATYGEKAVDVFYVTDAEGRKLGEAASAQLREALLEVARTH